MSLDAKWHSIGFSSLLIEAWGDEFAVFQPDSGKTHFFNQISMMILVELNKAPVTSTVLCECLIAQLQLSPDPNFSRHIDKILQRFDALGLVETVE